MDAGFEWGDDPHMQRRFNGKEEAGAAADDYGFPPRRHRQYQPDRIAHLGIGLRAAAAIQILALVIDPRLSAFGEFGKQLFAPGFVHQQLVEHLLIEDGPTEQFADLVGDGRAAGAGLATDGDGKPARLPGPLARHVAAEAVLRRFRYLVRRKNRCHRIPQRSSRYSDREKSTMPMSVKPIVATASTAHAVAAETGPATSNIAPG